CALPISGFMTGMVVSFKVSFGVIFIAICIYELFNSEYNVLKRFKNLLNLSAGAALAVMITLLPLIDSQSYSGYMDVIKYINYYSSITSFSIGYIKVGIKNFGVFFGYNFSILLIFLAILGSNGMFQRGKSERLLVLSILISLSLIFSIAFERKFFIYHFTRLFLPLTILSGFGLAAAAKTFKTKWYDSPGRTKFVIICLLAAAAAFSPISRWIALLPGPYYYMTNKSKYDKIYHSEYNRILQRIQYIEDAKYLKSRLKSDDKLIVMGIGGNPIYQLSGAKKFSRFAHPSFYFGNFTTPNWQKWIVEDVESADWLVVQDNDNAQIINGHDLSSYESLQQHEKLCSIVNIEFSLDTIILHSRIYKRIKSK
ncbi:MAG: 2 protein, partial [Bacteroidota bacterium]|nr:2 protein [Bacteroidota bacterium]